MNYSTILRTLSDTLICRALVVAILLVVLAGSVSAQNNTQGSTPAGLAPGAPAGSYALSDFENVNLYNGNLNFSLPLMKIGGRGGGGHAITLNLDHKWSVVREPNPGQPAKYIPTPLWLPDAEGLSEPDPPYGIGKLTIRQGGSKNTFFQCGDHYYQQTLTRLTFTAPGGTEFELRDAATSGQPQVPPCNAGFNRGTIFVTADGSAATFISDSDIFDAWGCCGANNFPPSGYMMMSDGTRYRIEDGEIRWSRDRNGNQMTFTYTSVYHWLESVTDSLNRRISIAYGNFPTTPYDEITFKGFGPTPRKIRINYTLLENALRSDFDIHTCEDLFPGMDCPDNVNTNGKVASSITLPDGRQYRFFYNSYAELARVVLPTGAAIEYDWAPGLTNGAPSGVITVNGDKYVYRRVSERRVYPDGGSGPGYESKMTYSQPETTTSNLGYVIVITENFGPGGVPLGRQWHYFHGSPRDSFGLQATQYSAWQDGREYWTYIMAADGTTVLRQIVHTFAQREPVSWWPTGYSETAPPNDVRLIETKTTLMDSGQVSRQTFNYDRWNNLTDSYDYDYLNEQNEPFIRRTHTDYLTTNPVNVNWGDYSSGATFNSIHIRNLPTEQWVSSDIEGYNRVASTTYEYDNYNDDPNDPNHKALTDRQSISGLCANYTSAGVCSNSDPSPLSFKTRGNATAVSRYLLPDNTAITTYAQYDIAGNVVRTKDAEGNETNIYYDDNFGIPDNDVETYGQTNHPIELGSLSTFAFPTIVTNALGHTIHNQYHYYLGVVVDSKDANGNISTAYYNDALDRPTQVTLANDVGVLLQQKSFAYNDDPAVRTITVEADLNNFNDKKIKSQTIYDGLGRTTETRSFENATDYVAVKQVPFEVLQESETGPMRAASEISNPFRPLQGEQPKWTVTLTDALGRALLVTTPDGAKVRSSYLGNTTTVEDQAGKQRKSETDALGRLTKVNEAPNDTTYNFQTSYVYDVLDNLRTVTQGTTLPEKQIRDFVYDSLSRLKSANNPEGGLITYAYDGNGNLLTKTDARNTVAHFTYDALNRVTQRWYDDGSAFATPTVNYSYDVDTVPNSKGRLTSVSSSVSVYNYTGYDALGRVTGSQQVTDGQTYSMSYVYDLAGNMTSQTYPTGRVVTQNFDNAGRMASISGQSSGGTPKTYANSYGYTAHGAVERMRLGNGLWEHTTFDPKRLQPLEIGLGISPSNSSLLKLEYYYGGEENNGNVLRQIITVPTIGADTGFTATQHYQYDQLNRLTGAQEVNGVSPTWQTTMPSAPFWQQMFSYDRFGNRAVDTDNTTPTMIGPNPVINPTTNRITPLPGEYYFYDYAGNMTKGQSNDSFDYDAENKLVQYQGGATQSGGANYSYDGDGRRVKKAEPSGTLIFVYNVAGQLVAEYTTSTTQNNGTSYLTSDTLGSPRVITKADGSVRSRHDYLPFGEELYAGVGNRTGSPGQGYDQSWNIADTTRQKFTSKERDNETGLDYFGARYYASTQGRFTSTDPLLMTEDRIFNPQELNLYIYCLNNPLVFIDPDGREYVGTDGNKVEVTLKNNQITVGTNASADLKRLASAVAQSGSKKAVSQFMKLANNQTKVDVKIVTEKGGDKLGYHQPHDKGGAALEWNRAEGKFDGEPAYIKDEKGNSTYAEATLSIYEGNITEALKGMQSAYKDPDMTTEDLMVATFAHEAEHDLDQKSINKVKARQEGGKKFDVFKEVESHAIKVGTKVLDQIKRNRGKTR